VGRCFGALPFVLAAVFTTAAAEDLTRARIQWVNRTGGGSTGRKLSALAHELDRIMLVIAAVYANVLLLLIAICDPIGELPNGMPWRSLLDSCIAGFVVISTFTIERCARDVDETSRVDEDAQTHFYGGRWTVLWVTQVTLLMVAWLPNSDTINRRHSGLLIFVVVSCFILAAILGQTRSIRWEPAHRLLGSLCKRPVGCAIVATSRRVVWLLAVFAITLTFLLYVDHFVVAR